MNRDLLPPHGSLEICDSGWVMPGSLPPLNDSSLLLGISAWVSAAKLEI